MSKPFIHALALGMITSTLLLAESNDANVARLYQIGADGKYCLSITRDVSGCVSGENDNGKNINVLDFIRGKRVVFENLSDAPHDMKFSGANAQDLPVQPPGGADAQKQMTAVDLTAQKISCSFHGAQLGVGYRVPNASGTQIMEGHKEVSSAGRPDYDPANGAGGSQPGGGASAGPSQKIVRTSLTDVAAEVLTKGRQADVEKLVTSRPELMAKLQELRPLLAQEIATNAAGGGSNAKVTALGTGTGSSALDSNFGAKGEGAGGAGGAGGMGGGSVGGKVSGLFGSAGGKGADGSGGEGGSAGGGGGGGRNAKRILAAANAGEDGVDGEGDGGGSSPGWASSILGMPTEKRDEGRGLASASLGSVNGDHTTLKNVLKNKRKLPADEGSARNRWLLIGGLLAAIAVSSRWVFKATKGKKGGEEEIG